MGGLLHLVQRGGDWAGWGPAQSLHAVPNVTVHPSTASVPITVLLYDGPSFCRFNVAIKRLKYSASTLTRQIFAVREIVVGEFTMNRRHAFRQHKLLFVRRDELPRCVAPLVDRR